MEGDTDRRTSYGDLALASLAASLLGSAIAATIVTAQLADWHDAPLGILLIFLFGIFIALPVGLLIGFPMLIATRRILPQHVVSATVVFALVGLLCGAGLQLWLDPSGGFGNAYIVFGACVAGIHPLVCTRLQGGKWGSIAAAILLSGAVVPAAAYAGESTMDMMNGRRDFALLCADYYGTMAFVADRAALEQHRPVGVYRGKWYVLHSRSLYAWERWVLLDDAHILVARDYAYVPSGFAGWITGGRRVERHCLSEKNDRAAKLLRSHGFGKRPTLADFGG